MGEMSHPEHAGFTGRCQCGACRFAVTAGPAQVTVCHCRMCQRATGNAFAPLLEVCEARVSWTGTPATWASSSIAERGFCATCGSPLFYRRPGGGTIEFMAGSLDRPDLYDPAWNHGVESRLPWLARLGDLPDRETFLAAGETVLSHQVDT
jgi:hypothetical protein